MKFVKAFIVALFSLLLTGCYTQLQYSQTMREITDEEKKEQPAYTWEQEEQSRQQPRDEVAAGDYADTTDVQQQVPIDYKDYSYAEKYAECGCNPYNVYNFYGDYYDGYHRPYSSFGTYLSVSPFYYSRWRSTYGYRYHPSFAISFSWGSPHYYHSFYYDPFYDPFYDHYWYRRGYLSYTYWKFYGNYGAGYYYDDNKRDRNTRYAPRSIGTNRVGTQVTNRSRDASLSGRTATQNQTVRTRSVGTNRTRATTNRNSGSTVNRTRSRSNSGNSSDGNSRTRSRENLQSSSDVYIDRTDEKSRPVFIDYEKYRAIRARIADQNPRSNTRLDNLGTQRSRLQMAPTVDVDKKQRSRPTFFQRMKNFFENNSSRFINTRSTNRGIRSRSSSSNRSSVGRSTGSSNRSSVTRSRSSSSDSRSSGSSSRSRSGGSSSSSGSDRSRGN